MRICVSTVAGDARLRLGSASDRHESRRGSGQDTHQRLDAFVQPFVGRVYCHVPMDREFSYAALARLDDGRDRWGTTATRTVYLAGDPAVALAEYARHREVGAPADARSLCSFRLQGIRSLDLRDGEVTQLLGLATGADRFLDRQVARRASRRVRDIGTCQGLIVPSMAFLDQPERFNVVLFVERLGVDLKSLLTDREIIGEIRLGRR
jgi:hypothetical protein